VQKKLNIMKKLIFLGLILSLSIACNQDIKEENVRLKSELDSIQRIKSDQDSTIGDFAETFNQVQANLSAIREKEEAIQAAKEAGLEGKQNNREQVIADIEAINELIEDNKNQLQALQSKLTKSESQGQKYLAMVENLRKQISAKDEQIRVLKDDLANLNFKMDQLNSKVGLLTEATEAQKKLILDQRDELNSAYYTIGDYKSLKEAGVVDKEGGFIGLGRTKTIAEDFNKSYFTKIDIRQTKVLPIDPPQKEVKILSNHPSESYRLSYEGELVKSVEIHNPKGFWQNSKYLVVLLD